MTHSVVAPSSSARRVQCSMSTTAEARFPDSDREEAAEGEAAHWGLAEMLHGRVIAEGQIAPNGVFLTDEMIEAAELVYDDVARELARCSLVPSQGRIEQRLAIPRVHAQSFGTPDFWTWTQPYGGAPTLLLYDFKFGHRVVEVYENWQCIEYVAGVLDETGINGLTDQTVRVRVKIAQPRAYHREGSIREWAFTASDIRAHINRASNAAHEALGPNPVARTGPECRDCRARHACTALQRAAYNAVEESSRQQPAEMDLAALAVELRIVRAAVERLAARESGLAEQAQSILRSGRTVPGWAVERGQGRKRWTKPAQSVLMLGQMAGLNLAKPAEPITPLQAEKLGFPMHQFPGLVDSSQGAPVLVPDDGSKATRVFGFTPVQTA
jgi:hypothetical protein